MATEADLIQKFKDLNIPVGADFEELIHAAFVGSNLADQISSEVNAKQDKIGYTPADDSKVVHTTDTSNWQKQKITNDDGTPFVSLYGSTSDLSATLQGLPLGFHTVYANQSVTNNPLNGISSVKGFIDMQGTSYGEGFLVGVNNGIGVVQYSVWVTPSGVNYNLLADDSKVAHLSGAEEISGQKTFDVAPIDKTTGNPYITKSDVTTAISTATANMADTTKLANFTAGVQSGGVDVATSDDLNNYYHANASDDAALAAAKSATVPGIFWFKEV